MVLCAVVVWYYSTQSAPNAARAIARQPEPEFVEPAPEPAAEPLPMPNVPQISLHQPRPNAPPATAPASQRPATYTVKAGDNLSRIAIAVYGDEAYWDDIAKANPRVDPAKLRVGQVLRLPDKGAIDRGVASTDPAAAAPADTIIYVVQPNDTLSTIAKTYYHDSSRWQYLYNVNKAVIGSNPNTLKAGMKLKIPPQPKAAE